MLGPEEPSLGRSVNPVRVEHNGIAIINFYPIITLCQIVAHLIYIRCYIKVSVTALSASPTREDFGLHAYTALYQFCIASSDTYI